MHQTRVLGSLAIAAACAVLPAHLGAQQPAQHFVVLGCITRQPASARGASTYFLTDTRGEKPVVYRVDGDPAVLEFHVGHYVEIAGPLSTPARGANAGAAAFQIKVERLSYLLKDCPASKPAAK
jgi:hypothetical protein